MNPCNRKRHTTCRFLPDRTLIGRKPEFRIAPLNKDRCNDLWRLSPQGKSVSTPSHAGVHGSFRLWHFHTQPLGSLKQVACPHEAFSKARRGQERRVRRFPDRHIRYRSIPVPMGDLLRIAPASAPSCPWVAWTLEAKKRTSSFQGGADTGFSGESAICRELRGFLATTVVVAA